MELDILVRVVFETVINVIIADGSARTEGHPFAFFRSQRVGMMMEFNYFQRTVQNHVMYGIPQIAKASAQSGNQLIMDDDASVFVSFFLGSFANRMPKRKYFIGINHNPVNFPAG